jgi:hypothetical protein
MKRPAVFLTGLLLALAAPGCRLVLLPEAADIETFPSRRHQVLAAEERIYVRFGFPVEALSAEECLAVRSGEGEVAGRKSWEGGTLFFDPQPDLVFGQRYVLALEGPVRSQEGRSVDLALEIPFYYLAVDEPPPCITAFTPAEGAQVGLATPLNIVFSKPMDTSSFKEGFSLQPDTDTLLTWDAEQREVTVTPEPVWANNTVYVAETSTAIRDALGIPLAAAPDFTFYAAEDLIPPLLSEALPALRDWPGLFPTRVGLSLNDLEYRDVIKIVFSEEMDEEATAAALLLDPPLPALRIWTDAATLVLVPETGFEMAREYRLIVSAEAADRSGNALAVPFSTRFTAAIPELTLDSLDSPAPAFPLTQFSSDLAVDIDVGGGPVYTCTLTFVFGGADFPTDPEKLAAQQRISVRGLFPAGVPGPAAMGYGWMGDSILEITFTGFESPSPDTDTYYLLEIPGGSEGLRNDAGSFLKEDIRQLFRVGP